MFRWQYILFAALALVVGLVTRELFTTATEMQAELASDQREYRENAMYFTSRVEREALDLLVAAQAYHHGDLSVTHDDFVERFDIFWSRLTTVKEGGVGRFMRDVAGDPDLGEKGLTVLRAIEPTVMEKTARDPATARQIVVALRPVLDSLQGANLKVGRYLNFEHSRQRQKLNDWIIRAELLFLGLALSFGIVIVLFLLALRDTRQQIRTIRAHQKRAENAQATAEAANEAKSRFLASMSHELRTPLNAVIGFGRLLQMDYDHVLDDDGKESLGHIVSSGNLLLGLVEQVLDLARIEQGQIKLDIKEVDVSQLLDNAVSILQTMAAEKGVSIEVDDAHFRSVRVRGDELRLKQVVINVVSNAIKYNRDNGFVKIYGAPPSDGQLTLSVQDSGSGIPQGRQGDVFTEFARLGRESLNVQGTGVGLSICKRLVTEMDGDIGFNSVEGEGSTFWVSIPVAPETADKLMIENEPVQR